jgi:hypothetical protein
MKHAARILMALVVVACTLLPAASASAKATRIPFTGTEWCDEGTYTFVREWLSGPNYHIRGLSGICYETANIPQMTGTAYLYDVRANEFGNSGEGGVSGKLRFVSDEGGEFLGTWTWGRDDFGPTAVGHGVGKYQGLELHWFLDESGMPTVFSGYILDPGGGH